MHTQNRTSQKSEAKRRISTSQFGISRSRLGWLKVRFDGGPSYPDMVDVLKEMVGQYGYLVRSGERLSGAEWIERILESRAQVSDVQIRSASTLMRN
ncbi:hypothetical protein [Pseudomonas savastanoi]|uniref:Uncharacterized protein n=2 Tax=Pseudomonas savastanoi pv. glycinea TaxID=318 RepID=A0A0P9R2U4_PSESG|nr:hypothetical protein [Pseudomonas savastanoi]EFW78488.1 hypothetical protein PsgB076_23576 [Pseudomonas savastanoi pv. glycinea str. B076]EFW86679.1 hypothetical protein PsgRace4_06847 [Pseudomonas savastanoi pv. glycinea str. race 4]EGH17767.1 hypothetical protein Pgy4_32946 [Pseudomonas savastanoi pv. glycinea str. race 4]KPX39482.1 Uncharacterized protein ALO37_04296 [Pseudomonas savastanoi pv. glycinea]MCQ3008733.1 hypothetical protein [Pseudomonas savastanoi]